MRRFTTFIFDLDNTVYDWYAAFIPAFYAMVDEAVRILDCDREQLLDELRAIHVKHRDVEHPFALLETDLAQKAAKLRGIRADQLFDPAFHAFNRARKQNLVAYPETTSVLSTLRESGYRVVAYTDSKFHAAVGRLVRLQLIGFFDRLYCRERGRSIGPTSHRSEGDSELAAKVVELPSNQSKPNPIILGEIVLNEGTAASECVYIGDSVSKDVLMAKRAGCFAVWAKFGAHTDAGMYERLVRVSHWTAEDVQRERNYHTEARAVRPDFICEKSLSELLALVSSPSDTRVANMN